MLKRILSLVVVIVLALSTLTSCTSDNLWGFSIEECPHRHVAEGWYVSTKATCSHEGEMSRRCIICHTRQTVTTEIDPNNHIYHWTDTSVTDCINHIEVRTGQCIYCNKAVTEERYVDGQHTITSWLRIAEPTCSKNGLDVIICEKCNQMISHRIVFDRPPCDENNLVLIKTLTAASCTSYGTAEMKCEECGKEYVRNTDAPTGHEFLDGVCTICHQNDSDNVE